MSSVLPPTPVGEIHSMMFTLPTAGVPGVLVANAGTLAPISTRPIARAIQWERRRELLIVALNMGGSFSGSFGSLTGRRTFAAAIDCDSNGRALSRAHGAA